MTPKYLKITNARYLGKYNVEFEFNGKYRKKTDFYPFLDQSKNPEIRKYLNEKLFSKFQLRDGDVYWGDYELIFPIADLYRGNVLPQP